MLKNAENSDDENADGTLSVFVFNILENIKEITPQFF